MAHHMYTVGMDMILELTYSSNNVIAIPTELKFSVVSNSLGCIITISTPLLFALGLLFYLH
jgi:heme/copper-type cytochrome/quinol oxidase subunit 1